MKNNKESFFNDETINIYDIWLTLKKRLAIIFIVFFICNLGTAAYINFAHKVYKCSNVLIYSLPQWSNVLIYSLPQWSNGITNNFFNPGAVNPNKIYSLAKQFSTKTKTEQARMIGLTPLEAKMINNISIANAKDGSMLKIEVDARDREIGKKTIKLTKNYINTLPYIKRVTQQLKSIYSQNMHEIKLVMDNPSKYLNSFKVKGLMFSNVMTSLLALREQYNEMSIVMDTLNSNELIILADETYLPDEPYKPNKTKIISLGLLGGLLAGIGVALLLEWFVRSRREYLSDAQIATR